MLAPPRVCAALRAMQSAGPPLATSPGLRVRRGAFTGANHVLLVREAEPKLGGLAWIRANGFFTQATSRTAREQPRRRTSYEAIIEASALRPVLRGSDIAAWRYTPEQWVLWVHDAAGRAAQPPPRARAYLNHHRERLGRRSGAKPADPPGTLFRVSAAALGHKVVWHDLAETLKAVAVPDMQRTALGVTCPIVPLNTVYFIATSDQESALLLAAFLNSLPVRTFARAIAERAKDARFRFFAWTVGVLPLPPQWRTGPWHRPLIELARGAHEAGCLEPVRQQELDGRIAAIYGLDDAELDALRSFDGWLRGER
jgi:hypothetical protein